MTAPAGLRTFSLGGGVQSTACLVLAAQGRFGDPPPVFLFANVGADSEHPATLAYVHQVAMPFANVRGLQLHELWREVTRGPNQGRETLYGRLTRPGNRSLPIPVRMADTGAPGTRSWNEHVHDPVRGNRTQPTGQANFAAAAARAALGPAREWHLDRWRPPPTRPAVVLDPFCGTGTTVLVARALGRIGIGVDLRLDYRRAARWRSFDPAQAAKTLARTWARRQGGLFDQQEGDR